MDKTVNLATRKTTCSECGEEFLRSIFCKEPHACKDKLPFFDIIGLSHVRAELKILDPKGQIPDQKHAWNIGYDVASIADFVVPAHGTANVPTGIAISVPLGFYYTIESRSSLAIKGITSIGGIIDATYTGQIFVMLVNVTDKDYFVKTGDRIAQLIFHKGILADISTVESFSEAYDIRGEKGFGSTGR